MAGHHRNELARLRNALGYSMHGLAAAFRHEGAFRAEVLLACVLVPLAFVVSDEALARALLIASMLLVMVTELLNSAVEATVDRISAEHHELAKRAKDIGSAAVFIALINLAVVWILIAFT